MSGAGKDGKPFDLERWVDWASSTSRAHGLATSAKRLADGRMRAGKKWTRRAGSRRACECGRMNPTSLLVCKCGKQTQRTKAQSK